MNNLKSVKTRNNITENILVFSRPIQTVETPKLVLV